MPTFEEIMRGADPNEPNAAEAFAKFLHFATEPEEPAVEQERDVAYLGQSPAESFAQTLKDLDAARALEEFFE